MNDTIASPERAEREPVAGRFLVAGDFPFTSHYSATACISLPRSAGPTAGVKQACGRPSPRLKTT